MNLSEAFSEIAVKELALVDIPNLGSNQHEINGSSPLRDFFKTAEKIKTPIKWHYFADDREIVSVEGEFTFYDAREKSVERTGRSEWRGYYTGDFLRIANPGDVLVLAKTHDGELHALVLEADSNWLRSVSVLLGSDEVGPGFRVFSEEVLEGTELELTRQLILDELGIALPLSVKVSDQELMLQIFGKEIPNTKTLSDFARSRVDVDPADADTALVQWIERETALFYALERVLVQERIDRGFESVEDFLEYSISIQQSRRSRMGLSFQHHLGAVFSANHLRFTPQARTERKNRPDFVFPGEAEYQDEEFRADLLVMLGAKSTVKERWRQVLAEADRISEKHLCTLEPGISIDQTEEMLRQKLRLVIPASLFGTYAPTQHEHIWNLNQFVGFVRRKQS